jgi:CIC family chloride channel protein
MVIGGSLGAVIGLIFHQIAPELVPLNRVPVFTILGMASFFAAAANTPVSTLIMVSEMTGSYTLLLPAMWVCSLAYIISRRTQLYRKQPLNRLLSPAHRGDFIVDVLDGMTLRDAIANMRRDFFSAPLDLPLRDMARLITETHQSTFPVVDDQGRYRGMFGISDFRQILYDTQLADLAVAQDLANTASEPLTLQMDLSTAMTRFAEGDYEELPVIDEDSPDKIIGLIRRQHVIQTYSSRLMALKKEDPLP